MRARARGCWRPARGALSARGARRGRPSRDGLEEAVARGRRAAGGSLLGGRTALRRVVGEADREGDRRDGLQDRPHRRRGRLDRRRPRGLPRRSASRRRTARRCRRRRSGRRSCRSARAAIELLEPTAGLPGREVSGRAAARASTTSVSPCTTSTRRWRTCAARASGCVHERPASGGRTASVWPSSIPRPGGGVLIELSEKAGAIRRRHEDRRVRSRPPGRSAREVLGNPQGRDASGVTVRGLTLEGFEGWLREIAQQEPRHRSVRRRCSFRSTASSGSSLDETPGDFAVLRRPFPAHGGRGRAVPPDADAGHARRDLRIEVRGLRFARAGDLAKNPGATDRRSRIAPLRLLARLRADARGLVLRPLRDLAGAAPAVPLLGGAAAAARSARGRASSPAITLGVHELGHVLLFWAGSVVSIAGGSLAQIAAPLAAVFLLGRQRDYFGVAVAGAWLSSSLSAGDVRRRRPRPRAAAPGAWAPIPSTTGTGCSAGRDSCRGITSSREPCGRPPPRFGPPRFSSGDGSASRWSDRAGGGRSTRRAADAPDDSRGGRARRSAARIPGGAGEEARPPAPAPRGPLSGPLARREQRRLGPARTVARTAALSLVAAGLLECAFRLLLPSWPRAALMASAALLVFFSYGHLHAANQAFPVLRSRYLLPAVLLLLALLFRSLRKMRGEPVQSARRSRSCRASWSSRRWRGSGGTGRNRRSRGGRGRPWPRPKRRARRPPRRSGPTSTTSSWTPTRARTRCARSTTSTTGLSCRSCARGASTWRTAARATTRRPLFPSPLRPTWSTSDASSRYRAAARRTCCRSSG